MASSALTFPQPRKVLRVRLSKRRDGLEPVATRVPQSHTPCLPIEESTFVAFTDGCPFEPWFNHGSRSVSPVRQERIVVAR